MKKDIEIPEVKDVYIAAIKEKSGSDEAWYVHIINDKNSNLDQIIINSRGYVIEGNKKVWVSSSMRHQIAELAPKTAQKVELISPEVFEIYNEYWLTFFESGKLYDRKFTFGPHTIDDNFLDPLPVLDNKGILIK